MEKSVKSMDVVEVGKALKSVQTVKCRLKKQKSRKDYKVEMEKVLMFEEELKQHRQSLCPKEITVTTMTEADIKLLDFAETVRALKSIQSKKCINKFQPESEAYISACKQEELLKVHRTEVQEVPTEQVRKSDIINLIEDLENQECPDRLERLKRLLQ